MRTLPTIQLKWDGGGPFSGDAKPVTRVTIQEPWPDLAGDPFHENDFLRPTSTGVGSSSARGVPFRWFQNASNTQGMREVPNIESVSVDRSIDQDAASFSFSISNQRMRDNGQGVDDGILGQPGYYTATRGNSPIALALWGHEQNDWNNYFVPNAVIRVYTGLGGATGDILTRVAEGNLALFGVFLVDEVRVSTDGTISVTGRDMMKLLIDQQLFPPLVPANKYPLKYERWTRENVKVRNANKQVTVQVPAATPVTPGDKTTTYVDSSADRWYGYNASIYGHRGTHSVDGNPGSYALSVGNSGPTRPFTTDWWEYSCGQRMNAVYLHPWKGGYEMYVSVKVNGVWQGADTVPYDASVLFATQSPAVDTGANIKYVAKFTVPHETAREFVLPDSYQAERVRITFRNHVDSGLGVWRYRAGVREFRIRGALPSTDAGGGTTKTIGQTTLVNTYVAAAGPRYEPGKIYSQGYMTASMFKQVDAFGDARVLAGNPAETEDFPHCRCVRFTNTGNGYYLMNHEGKIHAYGDAVLYGEPITDGFNANTPENGGDGFTWDMAMTHTGNGYWVLSSEGQVYAYGDAVVFGQPVNTPTGLFAVAIESHPSAMGYWIARGDGKVYTRGAATHYGDIPATGSRALKYQFGTAFHGRSEAAQSLRRTSTGNGYWLMTTTGRVYNFGDAKNFGEPNPLAQHPNNIFTECYWDLLPAPDDKGYLLVHANGKISHHGDIEYFGSAVPGTEATLRHNGNYLDYSDIIKDLVLWSGFLLYDPAHPANEPAPIYGSIESTGAFAKERLPDDIFDKRPVIDAITTIKEVVGYLVWVDAEGRFRFESPNWWHVGNFDGDGHHIPWVHDINDRVQLTSYSMSSADQPLRSKIIISSHDPFADLQGTVTHSVVPPGAEKLRGLVKPAMWINDYFMDPEDQSIMAELIGLHIAFQERLGQVSCVANPAIELNDQIRIYERQSEEVYIHYVRGISFNHNLDSGEYLYTLTTHWLAEGSASDAVVGSGEFPTSQALSARIDSQQFGKLTKDPGPKI